MRAIWGLVGVGLLVVPMGAEGADFAIPIDGGVAAGVITSLHNVETSDVQSAGFVGSPPTALTQTAHSLIGTVPTSYVEGHTTISATWSSADRGTIEFQRDGAILATCCANSVFNDARGLDDWHYTFTATANGVFRLGYRLTGTGLGAGNYLVTVNGTTLSTPIETPEDGSTVTNSQDFPLVAGQTYTFALNNLGGFSTTGETLEGYEASGSFTFELLSTAPEQVADLVQDVIDLGLQAGQSNAFQSKLKNALAALERGDTQTALALLRSFINSVEAQRGKALTDAEADALIAAAQEIIDAL